MPNASIVCSRLSTKLYDAMAAGKAIVATDVSDIRVTLNGAGWIVNPANAVNLAEAVIEALTDQDLAAQRGMMARDRFLTHYTIDALTRIFASIKEVSELLARIS